MTMITDALTDERAQAFRDVLTDYRDLPRPHATEIKGGNGTGVRMHFLRLDDVVQWSVKFGTSLQLQPTRMFVRASTTLLIDHVFIMAWAQLDLIEAHELLIKCGYNLSDEDFKKRYEEGLIEIPASHAFAISTLATAS